MIEMFLIEIVYMNVYIWQGLSNCTLKMGQVLCQLYLNKVGLKKKQTMPFHFITVIQFCRSMHTEGIRMGIHWQSGIWCDTKIILDAWVPNPQIWFYHTKGIIHEEMVIIHNSLSMDSSRHEGYYFPIKYLSKPWLKRWTRSQFPFHFY